MSVELAGIHPTRLELLRLRRRKAMAEGIVDILKKDMDALTVTLFELVKEVPSLRAEINEALGKAYDSFVEVEMIAGSRNTEEIALVATPKNYHIDLGERRGVLGIRLPRLGLVEEKSLWPRYSMADTPMLADEASSRVDRALHHLVKLAETKASIREILEVIAIKRRQLNRIQYKIIPQLDGAIRYIELILEETERQDAIRVRVLQRKRKQRTQKPVQTY